MIGLFTSRASRFDFANLTAPRGSRKRVLSIHSTRLGKRDMASRFSQPVFFRVPAIMQVHTAGMLGSL